MLPPPPPTSFCNTFPTRCKIYQWQAGGKYWSVLGHLDSVAISCHLCFKLSAHESGSFSNSLSLGQVNAQPVIKIRMREAAKNNSRGSSNAATSCPHPVKIQLYPSEVVTRSTKIRPTIFCSTPEDNQPYFLGLIKSPQLFIFHNFCASCDVAACITIIRWENVRSSDKSNFMRFLEHKEL